MASQLIKNGSGNLWKDGSGHLLKSRPMNEMLLPYGLIGEFDADHVNNVSGYAQKLYNQVSGGVDMIQTNASLQPAIVGNFVNSHNALYFSGVSNAQGFLGSLPNSHHLFIVGCNPTGYNAHGLAYSTGSTHATDVGFGIAIGGSWINVLGGGMYINGVFYSSTSGGSSLSWSVGVNADYMINIAGAFFGSNASAFRGYCACLAYYNRPLSRLEIIYNTHALGSRYGISIA